MKTTAKLTKFLLPAAFRALSPDSPVLLDPEAHVALATDGCAIAAIPLPDGFTSRRTIPAGRGNISISPGDGDETETHWPLADLDAMAGEPVYRIAFNPERLAALAAAMGGRIVLMELSADPLAPVRVIPRSKDSAAMGFLMAEECSHQPTGPLGEIINHQSTINNQQSAPPTAELPPPTITASAERGTIEVHFGGVPPKELREAIKDLGFRYSGRGTKKGIPPNAWYAKDNPYFRDELNKLLNIEITAAA